MTLSSNRLPILAAEIGQAHADVQEAAKTAAERAIAAGHKLIEARALVQHGKWLPWLREHCALAERTAQLYKQLARKGVEPAIVADLGLQGAAQALMHKYCFYRPMYEGDVQERRDWVLFALWRRTTYCESVEWLSDHIDWLGRHDFKSPDEWLGPEGQKFQSFWNATAASQHPQWLIEWRAFKIRNHTMSLADVERELQRLAETDPVFRPDSRRPRRRRAPVTPKAKA